MILKVFKSAEGIEERKGKIRVLQVGGEENVFDWERVFFLWRTFFSSYVSSRIR